MAGRVERETEAAKGREGIARRGLAAVGFPYRGVAKKAGKTVTRSQLAEFVAEGGTEAFQKEREGREVCDRRKRVRDRGERS